MTPDTETPIFHTNIDAVAKGVSYDDHNHTKLYAGEQLEHESEQPQLKYGSAEPCELGEDVVKELSSLTKHNLSLYTSGCPRKNVLPKLLQLSLQSKHMLFDVSNKDFDAVMQRYQRCKHKAPHNTSACFLVPAIRGPWNKYKSSLTKLMTYPKGTPLYVHPHHQTKYPVPYAVTAYYDKPVPTMQLNAFADDAQPLPMIFPGSLAGHDVGILTDTGASHSFLDMAFAKQHKFTINPDAGSVNCGGKTVATITGSVTLPLIIYPDLRQHVKFYLTKLPEGLSVILGNTWLVPNKVILNHEDRSMQAVVHNKTYNIACPEVNTSFKGGDQPRPHSNKPMTLSFMEAQELVRDGCIPYLVTVQAVKEKNNTEDILSVEAKELLVEYQSVFEDLPPGLPPLRGAPFRIETGDSYPVSNRGYRHTPKEKEQVENQVKDYIEKGWIQPSKSPYASAVLFVQKKDGSLRMCVDYRGLNKVTIKDKFPLPRIDDLIDKLHGASVFSSLDLQSGYHQIRVADSDVHKTAFTTHIGLYEYRVMPFGLCNAPSHFQRQMNQMFAHLPYVLVYLDDILVFSKDTEEHCDHLRIVLSTLKENQFYAKLSKCSFFQAQTKFLGFMVDKEGVKMDPEKVSAVRDWPIPKDAAELRSFLGLTNHYKRFILDYSTKIAALSELTKPKNTFDLADNPPALEAFEWLKSAITEAPVLAMPNFEAPFIVVTDASGFGVGAILMQPDESLPGTPRRPLAFYSAKLSSAQRNYPVGEQELLAVIMALRQWRCYLEGAKGGVTIVTDHLSNTFLDSKKPEQLSGRQARWQIELSRYDLKWKYEKGPTNVADPLSRCPKLLLPVVYTQANTCAHEVMNYPEQDRATHRPRGLAYQSHPRGPSNKETNTYAAAFLAAISTAATPDGVQDLLRAIADWNEAYRTEIADAMQDTHYTYSEGLWRYGPQILVPDSDILRDHCIALHHDGPALGHPGRNNTLELIQRQFWWPTIRQDVNNYVAHCVSCQTNKTQSRKPAGLLQPLKIPEYPWQSISMDLITRLPCTPRGNTAIVVFVDRLTKMVHFAATTDKVGARGFADIFMTEIFRRHGLPESVVSDRDPRFTSEFYTSICQHLGMKQDMSTAFHPQSDGQTERTNRTLEEVLRHYVGPTQEDWDLKLPCAEFAINNAMKRATGHSPFYLNYGRHPRGPATAVVDTHLPAVHDFVTGLHKAISRAKDCLAAAQARMKKNADTHRRELKFSVGDQVLLSSKNIRLTGVRKLLPRFLGPFTIIKRIGDMAYELDIAECMPKIHPVFHVSLLRPFEAGSYITPPPTPTVIDGEPEYEVERILNHRYRKIPNSKHYRREYLVKWAGYGHEHNSWESKKNCHGCEDLIEEYLASTRAKNTL